MPWSPSFVNSGVTASASSPSIENHACIDAQAEISLLAKHNAIQRWQSTLPSLEDIIHFARVLFAQHLLMTVSNDNTTNAIESSVHSAISKSMQISYESYCVARDDVGGPLSRFLTAQAFCKLPRSSEGTASILVLMQYIRSKAILHHIYGRLMSFDSSGEGFLQEEELESYIFHSIATIPDLASPGRLQADYYMFYVFAAVRKFFFFLDPNRKRRISIKDLIGSRVFAEWLQLLPIGHSDLGPAGGPVVPSRSNNLATNSSGSSSINDGVDGSTSADSAKGAENDEDDSVPADLFYARKLVSLCWPPASPFASNGTTSISLALSSPGVSSNGSNNIEGGGAKNDGVGSGSTIFSFEDSSSSSFEGATSPIVSPNNWFSFENWHRVYTQYVDLDGDQTGMLNRTELGAYRGGILTSACINRIFEECNTFKGEIDFKTYLDVVLALEYRASSAGQRFLFRLLDIYHRGKLTLSDVRQFFQDVVARLVAAGHEPVDVANVCDEVFDMVHPKNHSYITLEDLMHCRVGHTACSILLDAGAFLAYDRREETNKETGGLAADIDQNFD